MPEPETISTVLTERQTFTEDIIKPTGVSPRVVAAFEAVDRAEFMLPEQRHQAYTDEIVHLTPDNSSTISQPSFVAQMLDLMQLTGDERVLEIGTATGYQAALLSKLARSVHTVEYDKAFAYIARVNMKRMGYKNVTVHEGDGAVGVEGQSPFDAIIVTAGLKDIPPALVEQLAIGGRIVVPLGPLPEDCQTVVLTKAANGDLERKNHGACQFVPFYSPEPGGWAETDLKAARAQRRQELRDQQDFQRAELKQHLMRDGPESYRELLKYIGDVPQAILGMVLSEAQILDLFGFYSSILNRRSKKAKKPVPPEEKVGLDAEPTSLAPEHTRTIES